jgi:hypothetical protein
MDIAHLLRGLVADGDFNGFSSNAAVLMASILLFSLMLLPAVQLL